MSQQLPVVYIVDASIAVTGAFVSIRADARVLKDAARVVLVLSQGNAISPSETQDFWKVETIPLVSLSKRLGAMLRYMPALLMGSWQLRKHMRRDGAQHVILNDFYLMQGVVLRLLGYRGRIVTWVRCEPVRFAGPLARPMLALAAWSADRMVAVSSFIHSFLPAHSKAEVIYNFYAGRTRTPRIWEATAAKSLVYVGNYIQGKGQDMALEAFAVAAAKDATLSLAFYGADMGLQKNRDYRSMLQQRAQQLGIATRVQFHDFIPDTYAVLDTAYAALNFSVSESFSRTVLEASGAGVPVIATASGGPQEILQDGVTGYLIPVGDVTAASACILALAQDVQKAATMGEAGAARIAAQFSEEVTTPALRKVLAL